MKKILIFAAALFLNYQSGITQVESVNYQLKYNNETCLFDCYLVVNEGEAKKTLHRAQFNAQITLVAPKTSNVFVTESYMPLLNNQDSRSTDVAHWEVSNEIEAPHQLKDSRLVSIFPQLLPTAFYNELQAGDEVKLFSFKVSPLVDCAKDVRLYDNVQDPTSVGKGMGGSDFRNGFTIGGVDQKYNGNSQTIMPNAPVIEDVTFSMKNKVSLDINMGTSISSSCQKGMTYSVVAPDGKEMDYHAFLTTKPSDIQRGDYTVITSDQLGCKTEKRFNAYNTGAGLETEVSAISDFDSGIFPNPTQNTFSLTMKGAIGTIVTGNIVNLEGKVVRSKVVNTKLEANEVALDIDTNLAPGMYSLNLTINDAEKVNHKLLIIK